MTSTRAWTLALSLLLAGCFSPNDDTNEGTTDEAGTETTGGSETSDGGTTDTTTGDSDSSSCPPGTLGCPCDNGVCQDELECTPEGDCAFPSGSDGSGDTTG